LKELFFQKIVQCLQMKSLGMSLDIPEFVAVFAPIDYSQGISALMSIQSGLRTAPIWTS
jgi:hypothetical protein